MIVARSRVARHPVGNQLNVSEVRRDGFMNAFARKSMGIRSRQQELLVLRLKSYMSHLDYRDDH